MRSWYGESSSSSTRSRSLLAPIVVASIMLASCSTGNAGLLVRDALARPSPMVEGNGAVYLTIVNRSGQGDRLLSAESEVAAAVELHETIDQDGVMKMVPQPDGWPIEAGGTLELKPGGKHIMLVALKQALTEDEMVDVTLLFERAPAVSVKIPVKATQK